jgi:hypothetical protein
MKNAGNVIKHSIVKRQEAIEKFLVKKREFLITKEQITKDINEARTIWQNTLKQLPEQPFN